MLNIKFKIIKIWEQVYKIISILLIIALTISSIIWYLKQENNTDTFIISTIYALFLFFIGIYINYMENKIDEKFYDRKEYYLVLLNLKSMFETMHLTDYSYIGVRDAIISFQVFTGREIDHTDNRQPYIPEKGFKFKKNELDIENKFTQKYSNILVKMNDSIKKYITDNSINKKVQYPHIDNIFFNVKEWCNQNFEINNDELENLVTYIYDLYSELKQELDQLDLLKINITKLYCSYKQKVEWNIEKIEHTYRKRLEYEFNKEKLYIDELKSIRIIIEQINNNMCSYNDFEELSNITEADYREHINFLSKKILSLENTFEDKIDTMTDELLRNINK